ncbi:hypothetical protein [Halomonas korlensis]|uniref:Uncharacterized protein n=1 Tax=Halomonas korlensis TaxID=463301 RepID=A0A1I7JM03_9GAMM|nr:hypothetical protein [Halomonas korlensis]SFU86210.1 hypothetical protein SAMN04487955_11161 [Halomonas korlensis]
MFPHTSLITALQILALAGVGWGLVWATGTGRQVEQAALEDYCHAVVLWQAEAARDIAPQVRTGHPDWKKIAAVNCQRLRPAGSRHGILDNSTNSNS